MQWNKWQGRAVLILLSACLAAIVGCPPAGPPRLGPVESEVPQSSVISRVNQNVRAMSFLVRAGAVSATGKVVRASGKTESFDAHGTLFFREPHNLYMELKHSLAGKIEIGSNDREFWYWERFEHPRYFTGQHAFLAKPWETDIPLRPDQFLDMLGFRELPAQTTDGKGPTFKVGSDYYYLSFFDKGSSGRTYESKMLAIDRRPPYLVSQITYYNPDGRPWMKADMSGYRPIEGTAVLVPNRIQIKSLRDASNMTLEFGNWKPSDNRKVEQQRIAQSPLQRHEDVGEVIHLDRVPGGVRSAGAAARSGGSAVH